MQAVMNGKLVVSMLRDFGLCESEARVYFVLLTLGESKVGYVSRKAYVPQSKMYEVLDKLADKGFIERTSEQRPVAYRAMPLQRVVMKAIQRHQKLIERLGRDFLALQKAVNAISPMYEKYGAFRLFSPIAQRREPLKIMAQP
jgi:sugar-specific transcriptional regulator TrmB